MNRKRIGLFAGGLFMFVVLVGGVITWAELGDDPQESPPAAQAVEQASPRETGNAGLLGSTGTSVALVLALGVFAAAMVAGGRTATRRS